jgi:hypothetical protein
MTTAKPTTPVPKTAMLAQFGTFSAFITAPAPVCRPHGAEPEVPGGGPVVTEVEVGSANTRSENTHQKLVVPRSIHFDGQDLQWASTPPEFRSLNPEKLIFKILAQLSAPFPVIKLALKDVSQCQYIYTRE